MSALAWTVAASLGVPLAYAVLCVGFLLYVRLPDDTPFAVLEDLFLLLAAPFIAALLGITLLRR